MGGHGDSLQNLTRRIAEAWIAARPFLYQSAHEISVSFFNDLVDKITDYFGHRARWAAEDFRSISDLAPAVRRIDEQAGEVKRLLDNYQRMVSNGLRTSQISISQAHKCWLELLFPFCKKHGEVAVADPPSARAMTASAWQPQQVVAALPPCVAYPSPSLMSAAQFQPPPLAYAASQHLSSQHQAQQNPPQQPRLGRPVVRSLAPSLGQGNVGFVGLPASSGVVGPRLATIDPPRDGCAHCKRGHWKFECPAAYFARFGEPCPGFDQQGNQDPGAWLNGDITDQTKASWRDYLARHRVQQANRGPAARALAVNFS